jgi:hypothetical protein
MLHKTFDMFLDPVDGRLRADITLIHSRLNAERSGLCFLEIPLLLPLLFNTLLRSTKHRISPSREDQASCKPSASERREWPVTPQMRQRLMQPQKHGKS